MNTIPTLAALEPSHYVYITNFLLRISISKLTSTIVVSPLIPNGSSSTNSSIQGYGSVHQSDVALFGRFGAIWINGTQPKIEHVIGFPTPDSTFPFTRLAGVTLADYSFAFLYHQINGTTFAEEQWDEEAGEWGVPQYITVSDS